MYPGYSPADIEYGKAAQEAGEVLAKAKAAGHEWQPNPDGPQYSIGKQDGGKRKAMFQKPKEGEKQDGLASSSAADDNKDATNGENKGAEEETLGFVVDTNPPPVDVLGMDKKSKKRPSAESSPPEPVEKKSKKAKTREEPTIVTEDISAEVDARMKEKEEKRKKKEEKKRRRSSTGSDTAAVPVDASVKEPETKKARKSSGEREGKGKKKRQDPNAEADGKKDVDDGEGGKKKKRKKNKGIGE